jgi:hypothetical protein
MKARNSSVIYHKVLNLAGPSECGSRGLRPGLSGLQNAPSRGVGLVGPSDALARFLHRRSRGGHGVAVTAASAAGG